MSYPPEMRESIRFVEATRPRRLQETFPLMRPEEKQRLLDSFHPDHRADGFGPGDIRNIEGLDPSRRRRQA